MSMIEIKNRFTGKAICTGEGIRDTVFKNLSNLCGADLSYANLRDANLNDADLRYANLRGANLRGANLRDANLRGADLRGANLRDANLRGANLRCADLRGADLRGADLNDANLRYANLRGANLRDANLRGAKLAFHSHDLIAELLLKEASNDVGKLKIAGLILVCRNRCWDWFLSLDDPQTKWAIGVLSRYIVDGDDHPAVLDQAINKEVEL